MEITTLVGILALITLAVVLAMVGYGNGRRQAIKNARRKKKHNKRNY